ncbi:HNH endonuclease, partial [Demequina sp. NBRC 110053]|uniref:HNH endonuclease n=1 Tax=Demequina sp. NBRC 110053 TaxID=1570342 RepID=UPI001186277B
ALRRMAAAAGIIPQIMDGPSVVLDQGRSKRHFTQAQKLALVERDGGCAMCGAPPSWCDAHHIVHWSAGGATDLDNAVMLCVRCHHDVHRAGWDIHASAQDVWFTPPAEVDPKRRRRPGGRRLFDTYPLEPEPEAGGRAEPESHDQSLEHAKNCGLKSTHVCATAPEELERDPAPDPIERELEELVASELERWLARALRAPNVESNDRDPGGFAQRRDGPAHLHSQATRRTIDA